MGIAVELGVRTDSAAAKGTASRRGLGKTRHIDTCYLWVQERVAHREIYLHKVRTDGNLADLFTKRLDAASHEELMELMGMERRDGRHSFTPPMASHSAATDES